MSTGRIATIRRGTKRYQRALDTAHDCRVYSLGNYFRGEDCNPLVLADYMAEFGRFYSLRAKLTCGGKGPGFTLHVHSNCWFEFEADES